MTLDGSSWKSKARCAGTDTDIFYPPRDRFLYTDIADKAKVFCFGENGKSPCPVRLDCLWTSIITDEQHGIWGGLSHRERNAVVRRWAKEYRPLDPPELLEVTLIGDQRNSLREFIYNLEEK